MTEKIHKDYIQDIVDAIAEIEFFVKDMAFPDFIEDRKTVNAVIRSLEVLGEATKNIPDIIRNQYPEIPWNKMAGMRDKLIHEYFGVDLETVWQTIQEDLPKLKPTILYLKQQLELE